MNKKMRTFMIGVGFIAILAAVYWIVRFGGGFGPSHGNVFSLANFDAETKSVLEKSLRISPSSEVQFKHASLIGGKDWNLYVCFETSKTNWDNLLNSVSFSTRDGQDGNVPLEISALPWWWIEKEKVDSILCATEGYTGMIVVNKGGVLRVFIYTDGGPSGFPQDVWTLFKDQNPGEGGRHTNSVPPE